MMKKKTKRAMSDDASKRKVERFFLSFFRG